MSFTSPHPAAEAASAPPLARSAGPAALPHAVPSGPLDAATLAQLASSFFRALPGQGLGNASSQQTAGSTPALPPELSDSLTNTHPVGAQAPSNLAPPGSPEVCRAASAVSASASSTGAERQELMSASGSYFAAGRGGVGGADR